MPRTRKDEAPIEVDLPVIEARYVELDDWTMGFETFPVGSMAVVGANMQARIGAK